MSGEPRTFVFTGPTLDADEVTRILPNAIVLPPIAATDLWPLELMAADTLAVIDGFFMQRRAIRHKELVEALDRGVQVTGAASMGALRAAELDDFGMIGVGRIYGWYAGGMIEGDDEVAVVHGPVEDSYSLGTLALVNVRATLDLAVDAGAIDPVLAAQAVELIRTMPFTQRDHGTINARVRDACGPEAASQVTAALTSFEYDLKRADAVTLLEAIRDGQLPDRQLEHPSPHLQATDVSQLSLVAQWRVSEEAEKHGGHPISRGFVLACARMLALDYPQFQESVAVDALVADARRELGDVPSERSDHDDDVTIRRLLVHRGLLGDGPDAVQVLADPWLSPDEQVALDESARLRHAVRRMHTAPWRSEQAVERLVATGRFEHWRQVALRVALLNRNVLECKPDFSFDAIPNAKLREWCTARWFDGLDQVDDEVWWQGLADRGYINERRLGSSKRVYPFALLRSSRYDDLDRV